MAERKIITLQGPNERGFVGYEFNDSKAWSSQKVKADKKGRFITSKGVKYYIDRFIEENEAAEKGTPLSAISAAGEEKEASPLEIVKTILIERGDYAEIQRATLFTGSEFYVVRKGSDRLQVINASGLVRFEAEDPAEIIKYLDESARFEKLREIQEETEAIGLDDEYRRGLYNGLEFALAAIEGRAAAIKLHAGEGRK